MSILEQLSQEMTLQREKEKTIFESDGAKTWEEHTKFSIEYYNRAIPFLNRNSTKEDVQKHSEFKGVCHLHEKEAKRLYKIAFPKGGLREFDKVHLGYTTTSKSDAR